MRQFLLRLLGVTDNRLPRQQQPTFSTGEVLGFRKDMRDLIGSVDTLSTKLDHTITRDEASAELDERIRRLELGHAAIISGTKHQIRRTRSAAWVVWIFMLAIFGILVIQAHDLHITTCMLKPVTNSTHAYLCDAAFPLHGHASMSEVMMPGMAPETNFHFLFPPQLAGGIFYALLIGGLVYGIALYRRRSDQESQVEAGHVPENVLEKMAAAQEQAVTQSREDTDHHGRADE